MLNETNRNHNNAFKAYKAAQLPLFRAGFRVFAAGLLAITWLAITWLAMLPPVARAGDPLITLPSCELQKGGKSVVSKVINGDTVVLENGFVVRLVGIQTPELAYAPEKTAEPLALEAKAQLEALVYGQPVSYYYGGKRMDRYGRILAHLVVMPEHGQAFWVQGTMVRNGLARAYSFADNRHCVKPLLELESQARQDAQQIWGHSQYAVLSAIDTDKLTQLTGTFQLVEGVVRSVKITKKWIFLNFGENWKDDFTLSVRSRNFKNFTDKGQKLAAFEGQKIRVRGWLDTFNGPAIALTHEEQIENLGQAL